jgi:hypothetical protein
MFIDSAMRAHGGGGDGGAGGGDDRAMRNSVPGPAAAFAIRRVRVVLMVRALALRACARLCCREGRAQLVVVVVVVGLCLA